MKENRELLDVPISQKNGGNSCLCLGKRNSKIAKKLRTKLNDLKVTFDTIYTDDYLSLCSVNEYCKFLDVY